MNACVDWEQLEKKHNIVIDGNKANVSLGNKPLFRVKVILGNKGGGANTAMLWNERCGA